VDLPALHGGSLGWLNAYIEYLHQTLPNVFIFDISVSIRDFRQKKLLSLFYGSCHGSDATWQEISHVCGSVCSLPRSGS